MRFWLCKYGETLPIKSTDRKYRVAMIGETLKKRNHEVTWWASNFDHGHKRKIEIPAETYMGIKLNELSGRFYQKNVSLSRILHNREIGKEFILKSKIEKKPDLIYTSMPTIDMAYQATKYAVENRVTLVVDIRDLWPDVFKILIPVRILRQNFWFHNMNKKLAYILNNAQLVIAPTQAYLDWAKNKRNVQLNQTLVVPFGYQRPKEFNLSEFAKYREERLEITFAGTISVNFDLETVLKAAEGLQQQDVYFNIIGSGDSEEYLKNKYGHLPNVKFWGWCDAIQLHEILSKSSIGIAPYLNHDNFVYNIPNKPYEYMAYGLTTFTCLKGVTLEMLENYQTGIQYEQGNAKDLERKIIKYKQQNSVMKDSKRIIEIFEKNFSADIIYNHLVQEMERLVK